MRPDLALTATVSGEPMEFIARDVPTGVFFYSFQDTFPGAECFARLPPKEQRDNVLGFEAWADALLCRAMIEPRLTPELIQRLGSARDELAVGYLWGLGYHVPTIAERERLIPPRWCSRRLSRVEEDAKPIAAPTPKMKMVLRVLADVLTLRLLRLKFEQDQRSGPPRSVFSPNEVMAADYPGLIAVPPPNVKLAIREMATKTRVSPHLIWRQWPISAFIWTWRVALQDDLKKRAARGTGSMATSDIVEQVGRERS